MRISSFLSAVFLPLALSAAEPQARTIRGTVTYTHPWMCFLLQTSNEVIFVSTRQGDPKLVPGDDVSVTGLPTLQNGRLMLVAATYEKSGATHPLPEPTAVTRNDIIRLAEMQGKTELYGRFVRLTARLTDIRWREWGFTEMRLDFEGTPVLATLQGRLAPDLEEKLSLLPAVSLCGYLVLPDVDLPPNAIPTVVLRMQNAIGLAIVPDAEFKRRLMLRRLARSLHLLPWFLLPIVAALSVKLYRAHRAKDRLEAVIAERRRMAGDLHDSVEQHLAGARLYLDSLLPADGSPAPAELKPVELAREILVSIKREIRETIWNLRIDELMSRTPADVLQSLADRLSASGAVRVRTHLNGLPESLSEHLFSDLLYLVQEAVTNAIKHGGASRLLIASEPSGKGESDFALLVSNNGKPFDPAQALGPEAGHYGLSGMRERARRNNILLTWKSNPRITSVRMEIRP